LASARAASIRIAGVSRSSMLRIECHHQETGCRYELDRTGCHEASSCSLRRHRIGVPLFGLEIA
jgi:hypothetical protein